jgi:hypothetical protein
MKEVKHRYIHTSKPFFWLHISFLVDCIQDSIYRETIINLIYHLITFVHWVLVTLVSWMLVILVSICPHKPNGGSQTLRFDLQHQRARKKLLYGLNWNISFHDWNLDFGDSVRHQLLWSRLEHRWFWPASVIMARIWWVVSADRGNNGNAAYDPNKERDSRGYGKINSLGTWWKNVEGWGSPRKTKIGTRWILWAFWFWLFEDAKDECTLKKNKK